MFQKLVASALTIAVFTATMVELPVFAVACPTGSIRAGQSVNNLSECNTPADDSSNTLEGNIKNIINLLIGVAGIVCVGVIIYAAAYMMTSQGEASKVTKARLALIYALVGLIVALLAFAIVNFFLDGVFG